MKKLASGNWFDESEEALRPGSPAAIRSHRQRSKPGDRSSSRLDLRLPDRFHVKAVNAANGEQHYPESQRRLRISAVLNNGMFGVRSILVQAVCAQTDDAKRQARPDGSAKIKGHPSDLVLPMGDVARHHPVRAHIVQAGKEAENFLPLSWSACQRSKYIGTSMRARKAT